MKKNEKHVQQNAFQIKRQVELSDTKPACLILVNALCVHSQIIAGTIASEADLLGLPPIYIQAGDAEILYDMIQSFYDKAQALGANVRLDVWRHMNHDFQAFGDLIPESKEALMRIGQFIKENMG